MPQQRKSAKRREEELRLAIYRIERGRAHTKATKLSIAAVAREAGVTSALIHNHYPSVAEEIRIKLDACSRKQRDAKHDDLKIEREKARGLRQALAEMRNRLAQLASINEMLLLENRSLKAQLTDPRVVPINLKNSGNN